MRRPLRPGSVGGSIATESAASERPLLPPTAPTGAAKSELLSFTAVWLASLPAPCTLRIRLGAEAWHVSTSQPAYTALRARGTIVLLASELMALAHAAEAGRASRVWLAEWLARKAGTPSLRLDQAEALGGVAGDGAARRPWALGRVLYAYGCTLDGWAVGDGLELESV